MFYRFLGKFFLFFFVLPSIVRSARFAAPIAADVLSKSIKEIAEEQKNSARSRKNHPAGSRLR